MVGEPNGPEPRTVVTSILRIAVPVPLRNAFDYLPLPGESTAGLQAGARILVPFGHGRRIGYLVDVRDQGNTELARLKPIHAVVDKQSLLSPTDVRLLKWAATYYHHPLGEVIAAAFPRLLRTDRAAEIPAEPLITLTPTGRAFSAESLRRARRKQAMLLALQSAPDGLTGAQLRLIDAGWRKTVASLIEQDLVAFGCSPRPCPPSGISAAPGPELNAEQREAVRAVTAALGGYSTFLLDGVTGSGKTEVYLHLTAVALQRGQQVMVLLPEISLTPQLERRFQQRLGTPIAVFHSRLKETERMAAWLRFQRGEVQILLGTRSAVFTPMKRPGLIIIDEEHDTSFKQQEGFRFSARDVAIQKGRLLGVPVLLGSATPALESLWNTSRGRYRKLRLPQRAGGAATPRFHLLDIRHQRLPSGLSPYLTGLIRNTLEQREQVMLFLNRRGYAPTLICHDCGWVAPCSRCDARLVIHLGDNCLRCHHCGYECRIPGACPSCSSAELRPLGQGTERLEETITELFPDRRVLRIDRDSTRRVGSLEKDLERVQRGEVDILLGTQMLAKGHHFPRVTLVAMIDVDALLFSTDFRASERMSQLILQVAGRAGRAERPGTVVLQTRHPDHPLLKMLIAEGYGAFADEALQERGLARLPPLSHMALWRAESARDDAPVEFLRQVREHALTIGGQSINLLGPAPAPMLRLAGRYRYQLALISPDRRLLHALIDQLESHVAAMRLARRVRWSLDIDPIDCH